MAASCHLAPVFEHDDTVMVAQPSLKGAAGKTKLGKKGSRSNGIRVGLIVEAHTENESHSDSEEDEENAKLPSGHARIEWYPSGREDVVPINKLSLLDRSLLCGEMVCRSADPNRVGYVQDTFVQADFVVLPEKRFVICGVDAKRMKWLKEFDDSASQVHVLYDNWVGLLSKANQRVMLETQEGYKCWITEDAQRDLEDVTWKREQYCTYDANQWYENQPLKAPISVVRKAEWVNRKPSPKFLKKVESGSGKFLRFTVKKVEMLSLTVHWIIPLTNAEGKMVPDSPPIEITAEHIKRVKLLDCFPYQYLQIGDRGTLPLDIKDYIMPYAEYKKRFKSNMLQSVSEASPINAHNIKRRMKATRRRLHSCSSDDTDVVYHTPPQAPEIPQPAQCTSGSQVQCLQTSPISVSNFSVPVAPASLRSQQRQAAQKTNSDSEKCTDCAEFETERSSSAVSAESMRVSTDSDSVGYFGDGDGEDVEMESVVGSETSLSSSGLNTFQKVRKRLGTLARRFKVLTARSSALAPATGRRKREERQQGTKVKRQRLNQCSSAVGDRKHNQSVEGQWRKSLKTGQSYVVEALCVRTFPEIVWQDGICERGVKSTELRYFTFDLDDHGMLPGTCVQLKLDSDSLWPVSGYGMVVEASATDRVASVNWFDTSAGTETCTDHVASAVMNNDSSGSSMDTTALSLGQISGSSMLPKLIKSDKYSVYELVYHSDYSYYTGQLVVLVDGSASAAESRVGQVKAIRTELGVVEVEWANNVISSVFPTQIVPLHQNDEEDQFDDEDDEDENSEEEEEGSESNDGESESEEDEESSNSNDELNDEELQSADDDKSWCTESEEEIELEEEETETVAEQEKAEAAVLLSDSWQTESECTDAVVTMVSGSAGETVKASIANANVESSVSITMAKNEASFSLNTNIAGDCNVEKVPSRYKYAKLWEKLRTLLNSLMRATVIFGYVVKDADTESYNLFIQLVIGLKGFLERLCRKHFYRTFDEHPLYSELELSTLKVRDAFFKRKLDSAATARAALKKLRMLPELISILEQLQKLCDSKTLPLTDHLDFTAELHEGHSALALRLLRSQLQDGNKLQNDHAVLRLSVLASLVFEAFILRQFVAMCSDEWFARTVAVSRAQLSDSRNGKGITNEQDGGISSTADETDSDLVAPGSHDVVVVTDDLPNKIIWPFDDIIARLRAAKAVDGKTLLAYAKSLHDTLIPVLRDNSEVPGDPKHNDDPGGHLNEEPSSSVSLALPMEIPSLTASSLEILDKVPTSQRFHQELFSMSSASKTFLKAVKEELKILRTALPGGIFVKAYEERLDLFSFAIIGPRGTPFDGGLFFFDVKLKESYPMEPPLVFYRSYSSEQMNPNLYQDGKVCISLLGTWSGKDTEVWNPGSNLVQVIVSIQGLILNAEPYFNEAGYESKRGLTESAERSQRYNEMAVLQNLCSLTRIADNPPEPFFKECRSHLLDNGALIIAKVESFIANTVKAEFPLQPVSQGFVISARRILSNFKRSLSKLADNSSLK